MAKNWSVTNGELNNINYKIITMKTLLEVFKRLNTATTFQEKYPEYVLNENKVHVLFLSACLNENGYYRMILPALELNRTTTHAAIVATIHKWDFNKQFDDYDNALDFRLVKWADYVVLPPIFSDIDYIIKSIREINNDIDFVMDLDVNYHELPEYHPDFKKIGPELKERLAANLSKVDVLSAPNNTIISYYNRLLQNHEEEFFLCFERCANLLSHYTFENRPTIFQNSGDTVRIGVILDPSQGDDLKTIERPLRTLLELHKQKIEVILFGWTEKIASAHPFLEGLTITFEKPVPFYDYHSRLNSLCLDIGLLPFVNNSFNASGKAFTRFLDFSSAMVPMIAPNMMPLDKLIKEGDNGFIASSEDEWVSKTGQLIENIALRKDMGSAAMNTAWENFSYTPKTMQRLKTLFI